MQKPMKIWSLLDYIDQTRGNDCALLIHSYYKDDDEEIVEKTNIILAKKCTHFIEKIMTPSDSIDIDITFTPDDFKFKFNAGKKQAIITHQDRDYAYRYIVYTILGINAAEYAKLLRRLKMKISDITKKEEEEKI